MADIRQIDDLVRYGRLHSDTLVLEPDVKLVFFNDLTIPFTLKISGNTKLPKPVVSTMSAWEYSSRKKLEAYA